MTQDLNQGEVYVSSREGEIEIRWMVVRHAERVLDRLVAEYGEGVRETALGRALEDRIGRAGQATDVDSIDGRSRMLRGADGRFTGAYVKRTGRP